MSYTNVKSVMAAPSVTAHESTPYPQLVELLTEHQVSFLPVTDDDGKVVGVVSERDLLDRQVSPPAPVRGPRLERLRRVRRGKASGTTAAELMTTPAVTIETWGSVTRAAQTMQEHEIRHLVVVDEQGRLAGVVGRRDLLRVLLRADAEIEREIVDKVLRRELMLSPWIRVAVRDGVVTLQGHVTRRSVAATAISAVGAVEGVTRLDARVTWRVDDLHRPDHAPWSLHGVA